MTGDDHRRLGDDADRLVEWIGNLAFMKLAGDGDVRRCAALLLDARSGTFACSVYENRPAVCRDLERGSGACRGELSAKGERPKRALSMVR